MRGRVGAEVRRVDRRRRESEGKAKIEGYMSVSDEEAHQRSHGWQDVYSGDRVPKRLRWSMNPGVVLNKEHWSQWNDSNLFI